MKKVDGFVGWGWCCILDMAVIMMAATEKASAGQIYRGWRLERVYY